MKELGAEFSEIILMGQKLIAKAKDIDSWDEKDDKQMKIMKELVSMLTKIAPLAGEKIEEQVTAEEDELILQRFFERKRKELSGE